MTLAKLLGSNHHNMSIVLIVKFIILFSIYNAQPVYGKISSGKALLTGDKSEALLTKFAISAGTMGKFDLSLKIPTAKGMYTDERYLKVHFFADESWTVKASKAPTCQEKVKYAARIKSVSFDYATVDKEEVWLANISVDDLPADSHSIRYWYITLDDCSLELSYHAEKDAPEMEFQYTILNGDGMGGHTHFSADLLGMKTLHLVQILISLTLFLFVSVRILKTFMVPQGQVHIALITVGCALSLDILSNLSETVHAGWYTINGIGSYTFDCLASHFEAQCDALIALVLILVGSGWTLPSDVIVTGADQNMAMLGTNSVIQKLVVGLRSPALAIQQLKSGNPTSILLFSVFILHAVLAQWGRTFDEEFDSFHALDHAAGRYLMIFRVILGLIFLIGAASVRNTGRCPRALFPFLNKFQLVGLTWFLSLPFVSMLSSSSLPDHKKHLFMATGSALVQACSLASLVWLFTADASASAYHRLNTVVTDNMSLSSDSLSGSGASSSGKMWKIGKRKIRLD